MTRPSALFAALALAILTGRVIDRTTGQPLAGVRVSAGSLHSVSDKKGHYRLAGVRAGTISLTLESDDVPKQRVDATVRNGTTMHDVRACSTTLDYNCSTPAGPAGAGSGAS
jgi:hypothetical protein